MENSVNKEYSSFRDPSGYIYYKDNKIFRRINKCYIDTFNYFISSGLYDELLTKELIVQHKIYKKDDEFIDIEIEKIPFISYPYEWCFEQLKDAALLTLKINLIALKYNMILKDSSSYNIQFINGTPKLIDTLSFMIYEINSPWEAYGQFTRHFIAPLLLASYVDERLISLSKNYIDGLPLDLIDNILKTRGGFFARQHIKWQVKAIKRHNNDARNNVVKKVNISKKSLINIFIMLENQISNLRCLNKESEWDNYYYNTNYSNLSVNDKKKIILSYIKRINCNNESLAVDIGANDGKFSRLIAKYFRSVISLDYDYNVIRRSYEETKNSNENILPLILDLNNPTPAIGFACKERKELASRLNVDLVMALALIHHIAISNNVPFGKIAEWFSSLGKFLLIEYIPKEDSQVELLLKTRKDIFNDYNQESFEAEFNKYFKIIEKQKIKDSDRVLYLMERI